MPLPASAWRFAALTTLSMACFVGLSASPLAAPSAPAAPAHALDRLHVVLLNGGGSVAQNFGSHLAHLKQFLGLLDEAGVPRSRVTIFNADGADAAPDLAVRNEDPAAGEIDDHQWLLEGTRWQDVFDSGLEFVNSEIAGIKFEPATRAALRRWFGESRKRIKPGDTLLLFVTDHGTNPSADGKNPLASRIILWGAKEELAVRELQGMLELLSPQARVVTVMSQCFSGGFAQLFDTHQRRSGPTGAACGYFSSTADRPAYGCYPENRGQEGVGHAFQFLRALARSGRFEAAHNETLVNDDTPDVPLRTSDVWVASLLDRSADKAGVARDAFVESWLQKAFADRKTWEPEIRLLDRIGNAFGLLSARSLAEVASAEKQMTGILEELEQQLESWGHALGDMTTSNLERFLGAKPAWKSRLEQARGLPRAARRAMAGELFRELVPATKKSHAVHARLVNLRNRIDAVDAISYRLEVRLATLLRMRAVLHQIGGRSYLQHKGSKDDRAAFAALTRCEQLTLPLTPDSGEALTSTPMPPLPDDLARARDLFPGYLGIRFQPVAPAFRTRFKLESGASLVASVLADSPAFTAGIVAGDIVAGEPGKPFTEQGQVRVWTMLSPVGKNATLEIVRDGRRRPVDVVLGTFPRHWPEPPAPPRKGEPAPALSGLEKYRGAEPAKLIAAGPYLLFFWATWCGPCKAAVPELLAFSAEKGIPVIAVTDEGPEVLDAFFKKFENPFFDNVASNQMRSVFIGYAINATPTFVLVGANGRIGTSFAGYLPSKGLPIDGWSWKR